MTQIHVSMQRPAIPSLSVPYLDLVAEQAQAAARIVLRVESGLCAHPVIPARGLPHSSRKARRSGGIAA